MTMNEDEIIGLEYDMIVDDRPRGWALMWTVRGRFIKDIVIGWVEDVTEFGRDESGCIVFVNDMHD